jgi:hypothetical protein
MRKHLHDDAPSYCRPVNESFNYATEKSGFTPSTINSDNVHGSGVSPSTNLSPSAIAILNSMSSLGDVPSSLDRLHSPPTTSNQAPNFGPMKALPPCFQPIPTHLKDADVGYIRTKGALDIPHERLRNETIRCYLEYIHPFLPLLDSEELLQVLDPSAYSAGPQISLLLFHSVMFAAVPFVDDHLVREAGYANVKAARRIFFEKCKVNPISVLSVPGSKHCADGNSFYTTSISNVIPSFLFSPYYS